MATTIKHKRSSVSGNVPATSAIEVGELAINFADQKIYTKTAAGSVIELSPTDEYAPLAGATFTGEVIAPEFSGDITGAILFKGQAGEALTKGDPVYISGISGNTTIVSKADANDASKMPCFGIVDNNTNLNAACSIVTFGTLKGLDTSSFSEGDELYISDTATLTTTPPTGESSLLQKIAKVTRSHASTGSIKVMGAGRTNATPNLNSGNIFLGNGSNQSVATSLSTAVSTISVPLAGGTMTGQLVLNNTDSLKLSAGTTAQRDSSPAAGSIRYNSTTSKFEGYTTEWADIGGGGNATLSLTSFTGNGSAVDFTLNSNPQEDNTLIYIDGVYQNKTSYSINNSILTFSAAPDNGAIIEVTVPGLAPIEEYTLFKLNQFTGDNSTTQFTLSGTVLENNTNVYWDGVYQSKSNYSVSGTTLTFSTAPPTGVSIEVMAGESTVVTMTPDDNTVTTAKIADGAVTSAKLGAGVGGAFNDFAIKTGNYTAVTRDQLIVNSSSAVTITLPASPSAGNVVFIKNAGAGTVTVGRNGSNINSTADDGELITDAAATLVYVDSTIGWKEI